MKATSKLLIGAAVAAAIVFGIDVFTNQSLSFALSQEAALVITTVQRVAAVAAGTLLAAFIVLQATYRKLWAWSTDPRRLAIRLLIFGALLLLVLAGITLATLNFEAKPPTPLQSGVLNMLFSNFLFILNTLGATTMAIGVAIILAVPGQREPDSEQQREFRRFQDGAKVG